MQKAPRGAIGSLNGGAACSQRRVGIEAGWYAVGDKLIAPGMLDWGNEFQLSECA